MRVRACSIRFSFTRSRLCLVYIAQKELWSELDWLLVLAPAKRTMTLELVPHEIENHKLDLNVGVVGHHQAQEVTANSCFQTTTKNACCASDTGPSQPCQK